jgi:GNAT superfamily N-acetyltransferase
MASAPLGAVTVRPATEADVPRIVELIHLGAVEGQSGEDLGPPLPEAYRGAFHAIETSPVQQIVVAELEGAVVGTLSFIYLYNIAYRARSVAQLESVHVAPEFRSRGIGEAMVQWAIEEARRLGCGRVQLTSNRARTDAHRFYRRLGFVQSHEGMKLAL